VAVTFLGAQFLCAPLLGALSDRYGRRPLLLLGISGLGLTFLVTALAHSLWVIVLSRLIGGGLSANFAVAQAYAADITPPEQRTKSLGKLGAMFGIGFVFGPLIGGLLGDIDLRLPMFAAAGVCCLNWLYGLLVLPESLPRERRRTVSLARINPVASLAGVVRLKGVGSLVFALALGLLPQLMMQTIWALYTSFRFGWGPLENGLSFFVVGLVVVLVQGFLLTRLIARFGERRLILTGLASGVLAYAGYGLAPHGWIMVALIGCNFLGFATTVTLQGIVSKAAPAEQQGQVMATLGSLSSLLGILAPVIGNSLLAQVTHLPVTDWRVGAPFFFASLLLAIALLVAWRHFAAGRAAMQPTPKPA
jgi:MFS transporter, DHA1 family, tetracycline resistance protein